MLTPKKLIAAAKSLASIVLSDIKQKLYWCYYNGKRSESTFEATRKAGKRWTNCFGGVAFACKTIGIPGSALDWYGGAGKIVWINDKAKANAEKYFDFFKIKTRTVSDCLKKGIIQPADIVTYMNLVHTNMYLGNDQWYDTGHAYCSGSGEGARYNSWIGKLVYGGRKVYAVVRLKGEYQYRVQIGAFEQESGAKNRAAKVRSKTGLDTFVEQTDMFRVYCGSFSSFKNAVKRIDELEEKGVSKAFIAMQ